MKLLGLRGIMSSHLTAALLLSQSQGSSPKPQITPLFLEEKAPAFLLECINTTQSPSRPMPTIDMRIDGQVLPNGGYGTTGPQPPLIAPGGSWKEIVVLHASHSATARSPTLGAIIRRDVHIALKWTPGRHTVEFQCGGTWSNETAFYWDEGSR
jgi:hypothetical protein